MVPKFGLGTGPQIRLVKRQYCLHILEPRRCSWLSNYTFSLGTESEMTAQGLGRPIKSYNLPLSIALVKMAEHCSEQQRGMKAMAKHKARTICAADSAGSIDDRGRVGDWRHRS